jgi:hypothetical protein
MHTHHHWNLLRRTALVSGMAFGAAAGAQEPPRPGEPAVWMSQYQARARLAADVLARARTRCDALLGTARALCRKQALGPDIAARADAMADAIDRINAADMDARHGIRPASTPPPSKR